MVAAISEPVASAHLQSQSSRPPLLPSEKDNASVSVQRRVVRGRQVSSKYMSPSPSSSTSTSTSTTVSSSASSRRCPSPLLSRSMNSTPVPNSGPKRAQSVDRRRPVTPRTLPDHRLSNAGGEVSNATRLLVTSTRSLSVSFQGEAFSLPISKTKAAAAPTAATARKPTPERRRSTPVRRSGGDSGGGDQVENSKPGDQHRWPARSRQPNLGLNNSLSRSMDCSVEKKNFNGIGSGVVARALQQSMIDESRRSSFDSRLSLDLGHLGNAEVLRGAQQNPDANSVNESSVPSDLTASDTDSVSSGSTSGVQDSGVAAKARAGAVPRGIAVSARFWQETNSRLRRLQDPGSPLSTSPGSRTGVAGKYIQSKKFNGDSTVSSPRTMASPIRGVTRPASPAKLWTSSSLSPSRGNPSPSRVRNGLSGPLSSSYSASTPSIFSLSIDTRRGKKGEDRIVDAHMLRLLYNRYLQWRFVNARADSTFMVQRGNAEVWPWCYKLNYFLCFDFSVIFPSYGYVWCLYGYSHGPWLMYISTCSVLIIFISIKVAMLICVWSNVLNSLLGQISFVSFLRVASSLFCFNMILLSSFLRFNEKEDVLDSIYGMFGLTEYRNTEGCIMGDTNGISVIEG